MEQPKQINNTSERLIDDLKSRLSTQSRISIAAASFSIYAFEAMKAELEKVEEVRFIFTSPTFVADKTKKEQQPQKKFALHQKYMLLKKRQEEHI